MKKAVDNQMGGGYSGRVLANSKARFGSRFTQKGAQRLIHRALFLCSMYPLAVRMRRLSSLPVFLFEPVFQPIRAAFFRLEAEQGGYSNLFKKENIHV